MKVRAIVGFASSDGGHRLGHEFDTTPEQASDWIRAGLVERVVPEVETATRQAPEMAVTRKGGR
jgi:hypothetical protein